MRLQNVLLLLVCVLVLLYIIHRTGTQIPFLSDSLFTKLDKKLPSFLSTDEEKAVRDRVSRSVVSRVLHLSS